MSNPPIKQALIRSISIAFFREGDVTRPDGTKKPRDLAFDVLKAHDEDAGPVICGAVIGRASGFKAKTNQQKDGSITESNMLVGMFEATRASDGAAIKAPGLYLPAVFTDSAVAQLQSGAATIDFAVEIAAVRDPRPGASQAYQWQVFDLVPPSEVSPLAAIKARMTPHPLIPGSGIASVPAVRTMQDGSVGSELSDEAGNSAPAPDQARREDAKAKRAGKAA